MSMSPERISFAPASFPHLDAVEDRHFWFCTRRLVIGSLARRATEGLADGYRVLELGCGNGGLLGTLQRTCVGGRVIGMDLFVEGLQRARRRSACPLVQGDIHHPPFGRSVTLVGMFDVLEHLPDDEGILRTTNELLVPGGRLLITVPAHMSLWSYFDVSSYHCRRYSLGELRTKLESNGFRVEYLSEFMSVLFPLMWAGRRVAAIGHRLRGRRAHSQEALGSAELRIVPALNGLLAGLLRAEAAFLARGHTMPLGTSLIACARRV